MRRSPIWPNRGLKPPYGSVEIDWSHPLAHGLVSYLPINETSGPLYDLARPLAVPLTSGTVHAPGPRDIGLMADATGRGAQQTAPGHLRLQPPLSIFWRGCVLGPPDNFAEWGGVKYSSDPNLSPWVSYVLGVNDTSVLRLSWNDLGGFRQLTSSVVATRGTLTMCGTVRSGLQQLFINGSPPVTGTDTITSIDYAATAPLIVGVGTIVNPNVHNEILLIYRRELAAREVAWLHAEPYTILQPLVRRSYAFLSGFNSAWARAANTILQPGRL